MTEGFERIPDRTRDECGAEKEPLPPTVEMVEPLTVATAAIRIGEAVFTLPRPNRHHNVMWWLHVLGVGSGQMHDQGFVLSNGVFVDRVAAWGLAERGGQIIGKPPCPGVLFSEDLWGGGADLPAMEDLKRMATVDGTPERRRNPGRDSK